MINYNDKFSDKKICEKYKYKINNILNGKKGDNESVVEAWGQLKEIEGASMKVLGRTKLTSKSWFNIIWQVDRQLTIF